MPSFRCSATLENDLLILETGRLRWTLQWNHGHLVSRSLGEFDFDALAPDMAIPSHAEPTGDGTFRVEHQQASSWQHEHLRVEVRTRLGTLEVRRVFRLLADCPAIACDFAFRGTSACSSWLSGKGAGNQRSDIDTADRVRQVSSLSPVALRLAHRRPHARARAVQFFDITDWRYDLVSEREILTAARATPLTGNLLLWRDVLDAKAGMFVLREAPCSDVQLAHAGADFVCRCGLVQVVGLGVEPDDLCAEEWVSGYSVVVGSADADLESLQCSLRDYQHRLRRRQAQRDDMVLMNTWGDRSGGDNLSEAFAMAEIDRAAELGISHFQIDDGWQLGRSFPALPTANRIENFWQYDRYWNIDPAKFPRGLQPVMEHGRQRGVKIGIWFAPSRGEDFANWQRDAERVLQLHHEYGIDTFKIDMTDLATRRGDANLRRLFDTVLTGSDGRVILNLDVTARRRYGYHDFTRYGNVFVENRYTDWGNYYPHWTLRALWSLARYVPAQRLQIEFLNTWRNAAKYSDADPLAPSQVPFAYAFAITMMAQPLAWFEAGNLPSEAWAVAPLIRAYRQLQADIHDGAIYPIGPDPDGTQTTGFVSVLPSHTYVLVLRECDQRATAVMRLPQVAGRPQGGQLLLGDGQLWLDGLEARVALPRPFSFALFRCDR